MKNQLLGNMFKNYIIYFIVASSFSFSLTSCNGGRGDVSVEPVKGVYLCPMNCEGSKSDKPGSCPVCKMLLVKEIEVLEMLSDKKHSDKSVFNLDAFWVDQNNEEHQLADYRGKLYLTTMIFTNCDYACPNLLSDLQNIEDNLTEKAKKNIGYLLVTMDPDNDTPEKLNKYAENFDLDENMWKFLRGDKDATYQYSKLLGIGYKKFENGMYGHSNILSLLNESGEIIYQIEGIHVDNSELISIINSL